ncbi:BRO family protein [Xenorhabdus sp. XENO-10]|uniref:BRO family protein n=1 Tax=Xenorhabdus yunnanensis TaxID=3025878 RepID=A0ABT5LKF3_9GAMM|nr:BRO family protein [Xenorhabdus yunnanensis]MDC9591033.1 BRO family protein [Xenorhabdus yunnanensis]
MTSIAISETHNTNQLTFRSTVFNTVSHANDIWLTAPELAKALQYKKTDAVTQIYERNSDEFTPAMTLTLKLSVNGINNSLRKKLVRVFSLRGAHLVAMFSKTDVAKEFRKWVLDILDREVEKDNSGTIKTTVQQRNPLKNAVNLLVSKKGILYPEAYSLVHQRFNVEHIDELTADQLPQAIEYVHKMALEGEYIPKDVEPSRLIHDEIVRLEKAVSMFNSGYELWRKNIFVNLIQMDVPLSGSINAMLKDSLSLLRDLKQRVSTRISAK